MKLKIITIAFLIAYNASAQDSMEYTGKHFFAITVPNTDSTSKWYEEIFQLKLLKEFKSAEKNIHVRIIGNNHLKVELVQNENSLSECSVQKDDKIRVRSCFKAGLYVNNIALAQAYLRKRSVLIKYGPFEDKETHTRSFIIEDPNGFLIQVLADIR